MNLDEALELAHRIVDPEDGSVEELIEQGPDVIGALLAELSKRGDSLTRAGDLLARATERRDEPLAWESVGWTRENPEVVTLRLTDGSGSRVARIPVEKAALVGAAAKLAKDTMRDEARAAKRRVPS